MSSNASEWVGYNQAVSVATTKTLYTTLFVLVFMLVFILCYRHLRSQTTNPPSGSERYIGNVGGQGTYDFMEFGVKAKKQLGCYTDMDCPDETKCSVKGVCVPLIHELPVSKHTMKLGRGRDDEKATG